MKLSILLILGASSTSYKQKIKNAARLSLHIQAKKQKILQSHGAQSRRKQGALSVSAHTADGKDMESMKAANSTQLQLEK